MLAGKKFSDNGEVIVETEACFDANDKSFKDYIEKLEKLYLVYRLRLQQILYFNWYENSNAVGLPLYGNSGNLSKFQA